MGNEPGRATLCAGMHKLYPCHRGQLLFIVDCRHKLQTVEVEVTDSCSCFSALFKTTPGLCSSGCEMCCTCPLLQHVMVHNTSKALTATCALSSDHAHAECHKRPKGMGAELPKILIQISSCSKSARPARLPSFLCTSAAHNALGVSKPIQVATCVI
jgi:hypothetical protein